MNDRNLKPFNLDAALAGEPVILRDGSKAFVRYHETEHPIDPNCRFWGVTILRDGSAVFRSWTEGGRHNVRTDEDVSSFDIIGMYPTSKTRIINGFEVPVPETEEPASVADFFVATPTNERLYGYETWSGHSIQRMWLNRGLVFLNKEDAIANSKAMLGIDPYPKKKQ